MRRGLRVTLPVACCAAAVLLAACTGVPESSAPQSVAPAAVGPSETVVPTPPRDVDARTIVSSFLTANAAADLSPARAYLTRRAAGQWSTQKVTVVSGVQIKSVDTRTGVVPVLGRVVGTINSAGVYQPSLQGRGDGGPASTFPFTMKKVDGQFRIDLLRPGLLVSTDDFRAHFFQHTLYFDDTALRNVLPDVRWTAIPVGQSTQTQLALWLVNQLAAGPRPEFTDAVASTFPAQADVGRIFVRSPGNGSLSIEIPGSSQLGASARTVLARQLARTLEGIGGRLTITDDATPVTIPALHSTSFDLSSFGTTSGPAGKPDVYYLFSGKLTTSDGRQVDGPLGDGVHYYLTSVALTNRRLPHQTTAQGLTAAAVTGPTGNSELSVGTQEGRLRSTALRGLLTRPCWAPNADEVWIGVGNSLARVTVTATSAKVSTVQLPPTAGAGRILSVRLSPDGTQVALVVAAPGATSGQLFVGAIIRDTGTVRLGTLMPLSPNGVLVTDADWTNSARLTVVGSYRSTGESTVSDVIVDGSLWVNHGTADLPDPPQRLTASGYGVWLDTGDQIWFQDGPSWDSPSPYGSTTGYAPTYVVG